MGVATMPATGGATAFIAAIVAAASLCSIYNLVSLVPESHQLRRFKADPSCRQTIASRTDAGKCRFELERLVGSPTTVMRRDGPSYILTLKSGFGATQTVEVDQDIQDQLSGGVKAVGTLRYNGQIIVVYAGSAAERQEPHPSLGWSYTLAAWSGALAILFAVPLVLRIRQRTGRFGAKSDVPS